MTKKKKDPRNILKLLFEENQRYNKFGNVVEQIQIEGFRCHEDTIIEFKSPVTAFCGLNGTGKSTILQLMAVAYKSPDDGKTYKIGDFIKSNILDINPFKNNAKVTYWFCESNSSNKPKSIIQKKENTWKYPERYSRTVCFIGMKDYLPAFEQSDCFKRFSPQVTQEDPIDPDKKIKIWTNRVLRKSYDSIKIHTLKYQNITKKITCVEHNGLTYSESHMGYGEARSHFLIQTLESLPEKSLVLIEEPELSLHNSAQYQFGWYLMDVAIRKKHQIIITTHSDFILHPLPENSRIYLEKDNNNTNLIQSLTSSQARSLMSEGHEKDLTIFVEDETAKAILKAIIREIDKIFLRGISIIAGGGADELDNMIKKLNLTGINSAVVLDGDKQDQVKASENIFALPGKQSPELELYADENVQSFIKGKYGINLKDFVAGLYKEDHHLYFKELAKHLDQSESSLISEVVDAYTKNLSETLKSSLVEQLKESSKQELKITEESKDN